jgi:hypothetical protein
LEVQSQSSHLVRKYNCMLNSAPIATFKVPKVKDLTLLEQHPQLLELKWCPDGDDIGFRVNSAFKVLRRIQLFSFLDKVLANQAEMFLQASSSLPASEIKGWHCPDHDLALLMAIHDKGVPFLTQIKQSDHY